MNRKIKVLVVDDEILVRIGIIHAIRWEDNGFEIVGEASDGESCLQMAERLRPDLIVLDINMPGMNGIQVLHELKERDYPGKAIMLTCYDEFEYVREALKGGASDYVLKSNLNENGLLGSILSLDYGDEKQAGREEQFDQKIMAEKYLRQKIDGFSCGRDGKLTFSVSCFCVIAGRIRNMDKVLSRYEQKGMELFYSSLNSILEQALQRYREYDVIQYTMDTIGIFISFSDTSSTQEIHLRIRRLVPHIHSIVQNYLDLDMIFGISSFQFGEKEIKKAWEQAGLMLDRSFFEKRDIFFFDDLYEYYRNRDAVYKEITDREVQLKSCIVDGRLEEIREGIQAYFEQLRKGKIAESRYVVSFCQDVVKLIQAQGRNWGDIQILQEISEQETLEEMESLIYAYLDKVIPESGDQNANWLVRRACEYIRENYRQDITLSNIAEYLELSESYTSRIFNKQMGMNIPAYINQLRIEEAKELLKSTNKKIYEIAVEAGFSSTTAFHVAFKKQEGITPIEFRNQ